LRDAALVTLMTLLLLAPFAGKAVHIDDPMYLWAARQIQRKPLDFYGFDVNWYGIETPMAETNKNPPLVSYYLALSGAIFGWSEWALHLCMLLPAVAVLLGVAILARFLGAPAAGAALTALAMPALFVSSTTLMSDILMLAFWCGALTLWMWGLRRRRDLALVCGAILAGLCPLTKYFGLSLLPLLAAHSWIRERRVGRWALYLFIPIGFVAGYEIAMTRLYSHDPFFDVASYSMKFHTGAQLGIGVLFFGGCLLPTLLFSPMLWSRRQLLGWLAVAACGGAVLFQSDLFGAFELKTDAGIRWGMLLQATIFFATGLQVLTLAALDLRRDRSADGWLLALWVGGVFAFAAVANWTVNARAVLPAAPAVAILIWRRMARRAEPREVRLRSLGPLAALGGSLVVAVAVAWGDWQLADTARVAAKTLGARYGQGPGMLWFQGSWGFQYYMESNGAHRTVYRTTVLQPGDVLISPNNNTNVYHLSGSPDYFDTIETFAVPVGAWITTMSPEIGAGFYTSVWGPLPYVFGPTPPEAYLVQKVDKPIPWK